MTDLMPCGHPVACVWSSGEGTSHCAWCADVADATRYREACAALDEIGHTLQPADAIRELEVARKAASAQRAALQARIDAALESCDAKACDGQNAAEHGYRAGIADAARAIRTTLRGGP